MTRKGKGSRKMDVMGNKLMRPDHVKWNSSLAGKRVRGGEERGSTATKHAGQCQEES